MANSEKPRFLGMTTAEWCGITLLLIVGIDGGITADWEAANPLRYMHWGHRTGVPAWKFWPDLLHYFFLLCPAALIAAASPMWARCLALLLGYVIWAGISWIEVLHHWEPSWKMRLVNFAIDAFVVWALPLRWAGRRS